MNLFKKSLIAFSFFIFHLSFFHALPAITPSVPDFSGQYVYYRDTSFERESYIGIVYYDDNTYGLRYYAPATGKGNSFKPEKNIHILFTVDPAKENLELTGERILTTITPEDTDLVNYIHDFFYEMTKRRQNAGSITERKADYQDYAQFGGMVTLYFNPLIPIFNLERIDTVDKKTVLQIVSAGQLVSSEDQSFAKFTGINEKFKDKTHKFKRDKKAAPLEVSYQSDDSSPVLTASLDSSWLAAAENFYTLNNVAVFTVNEVSGLGENQFDSLKRRILLGTDMVYPDWKNQKSEQKENGTLFTQISYHVESNAYTYDFKFLRQVNSNTAALYTLTVFAGSYESNKKYFKGILDSLK